MEGEFLFSFLQPKYKNLADVAEALEKQVYNDVPSALSKARLFAEKLAKYVMEIEDITVYYEMKHVEVVQKLYREGILNEEMHFRFEWIRKMGNKAVHEANFGSVEDALKAHKLTYDLAVWFMELYGDVEFKAPTYKSPKPAKEHSINTEEIKQTVAETLEKSLEKTLEAKLQAMQEALLKLTQVQQKEKEIARAIIEQEVQKETPPVVEQEVQKEEISQIVAEKRAPSEEKVTEIQETVLQDDFDLMDYLQEHNIEVIDKRSAGGALWLLGGWELKEVLDPLKVHRIYFRFTAKGGRVTKRKPAWFLMGKNTDGPQKKQNASSKKEEKETKQVDRCKEAVPEKQVVQQLVETREVNEQQLIIPSPLKPIQISEYEQSSAYTFGEYFGLETFGEIKDDHLREWYRKDKQTFYDLAIQLWFLGCEYKGNLAKLVNLPCEQERKFIVVNDTSNELLSEKFPQHLADLFVKFGVRKIKQLNGLPMLSVRWLTAESFDEFLKCLNQDESSTDRERSSSQIEETVQENKDVQNDEFITLCMGTECLTIPSAKEDIEITPELIKGCNNLINQLRKRMGICTIGDLPKDLLPLRERLHNVGPKVIEKFFKQLGKLGEVEALEVVVEPIGMQGEEVTLNGERVEIPTILREETLEIEDFLSCRSIVKKLHEAGVYKYKQLPLDLLELKKLPGVGNLGVKRFFEYFKHKVEVAEKQEEVAKFYSNMTEEEKLNYELQNLKELMQSLLDTDGMQSQLKISEKALSILRDRYEGTMKGKRPTLEEAAQSYGMTRERVRQIVKGAVGKIKLKAAGWLERFQAFLASHNNFVRNNILIDGSFCEYLLLEMLEAEDVNLCFEKQFFTVFTRNDLQDFKKRINTIFSERLKGKLLEKEEYEVVIESVAQELKISSLLVRQISQEIMYCTAHNKYVLSKSTKADIVEIVLRQFPNGVEVYKEYEMLNEKANAIIPDSFHGERDFSAICTRDEASEQLYLWGRGIYIHRCFVRTNKELIEMIAKEAANKLQKKPVIMVTYLFNQYKDVLQENNVPTEYALYTLLRKYGAEYIALPTFPKIIQIGDTGSIRNADLIREFIRSKNGQVSTKEIRNEFMKNRGWKAFTVDFTLSSTNDIVQSDYGYCTLLEFYDHLNEKVLEPIAQHIETKFDTLTHIQMRGLFQEFESYCIANGIHTSYLLYHLLRSYYEGRFTFLRYPHIVKAGSDLNDISVTSLVEDYILEQGYEVSREEVMDWLVNEVGARENALDVALQKSECIFYYTRGQYAEYVHEDTIGWNTEKQLMLKNVILALLEREKKINDKTFVLVEQSLSENLPELDGGLPWTSDLLVDCLKRDGQFLLLGSKGTIVIDQVNTKDIQTETDFIQHVLVQEFGGSVKVIEMRRRLMQYNFSHDGEFLFETESLLAEGTAPFIKVGDELISKHLVEV
ncbi:sigma factor-like helix-turn-helix DNA-binding protein [Bacillus cytotoxicus]|uniref:sigma factor-like helix-turn-helix DNA-binding protein n=1 Tax=Bacillus cytotoxicus TaxID=580165 RepID=UPI002449C493|nr:sigma factor-like helix-turn-helix DNA-binding protein [Bacillus cytotoxicus]MDH2879775.1 hypothetical protein [Bacillus cytotoxicus]